MGKYYTIIVKRKIIKKTYKKTMTMKSIFFAVAVAALVGAAIASCPNACSGHGSCGNHDRCTCYANFVGGDCSEKACPYGRSGQECSGRGTCDRGAGSCECADGYSGASCQRTSCPNDCSGKGSCDTTTGMCSCAGGYSGNDCGTRLCPKGDDPLTHEVENSGYTWSDSKCCSWCCNSQRC